MKISRWSFRIVAGVTVAFVGVLTGAFAFEGGAAPKRASPVLETFVDVGGKPDVKGDSQPIELTTEAIRFDPNQTIHVEGVAIAGAAAEQQQFDVTVRAVGFDGALHARIAAAEAEAARLSLEARKLAASPEGRQSPRFSQLRERLLLQIETAFEARQQLQQHEIKELRERLAKIERQLANRNRLRREVVARRAAELLDPDLQWDRWETPAAAPAQALTLTHSDADGVVDVLVTRPDANAPVVVYGQAIAPNSGFVPTPPTRVPLPGGVPALPLVIPVLPQDDANSPPIDVTPVLPPAATPSKPAPRQDSSSNATPLNPLTGTTATLPGDPSMQNLAAAPRYVIVDSTHNQAVAQAQAEEAQRRLAQAMRAESAELRSIQERAVARATQQVEQAQAALKELQASVAKNPDRDHSRELTEARVRLDEAKQHFDEAVSVLQRLDRLKELPVPQRVAPSPSVPAPAIPATPTAPANPNVLPVPSAPPTPSAPAAPAAPAPPTLTEPKGPATNSG